MAFFVKCNMQQMEDSRPQREKQAQNTQREKIISNFIDDFWTQGRTKKQQGHSLEGWHQRLLCGPMIVDQTTLSLGSTESDINLRVCRKRPISNSAPETWYLCGYQKVILASTRLSFHGPYKDDTTYHLGSWWLNLTHKMQMNSKFLRLLYLDARRRTLQILFLCSISWGFLQ